MPLRRWIDAWAGFPEGTCRINRCDQRAAAVFEAYSGDLPALFYVCAAHVALLPACYPIYWPVAA